MRAQARRHRLGVPRSQQPARHRPFGQSVSSRPCHVQPRAGSRDASPARTRLMPGRGAACRANVNIASWPSLVNLLRVPILFGILGGRASSCTKKTPSLRQRLTVFGAGSGGSLRPPSRTPRQSASLIPGAGASSARAASAASNTSRRARAAGDEPWRYGGLAGHVRVNSPMSSRCRCRSPRRSHATSACPRERNSGGRAACPAAPASRRAGTYDPAPQPQQAGATPRGRRSGRWLTTKARSSAVCISIREVTARCARSRRG